MRTNFSIIKLQNLIKKELTERKGMKQHSKPSKLDVELEIGNFLSNPWDALSEFPTNAFAWMSTIRPQLLFYGVSPKGVESFNPDLERDDVIQWIKGNYFHIFYCKFLYI